MATIKLSNDVLINSNSLRMFTDSSNILASGSTSYTPTQDCIMVTESSGTSYYFWINDVRINGPQFAYVRQGDAARASGSTIKAFGVK